MILGIHAKELRPYYQRVVDARSELNTISTEHKHAYEQGDIDGERFLKPYTATQLKIEKLGEVLKEKIAEHAKSA